MSQTALLWPPSHRPPFPVLRFSVDDYHRMIDAGVFGPDARVELLDGWIFPRMTRNPPHDAIIDLIRETMPARIPEGWRFRMQSAITLATSEPEPDGAVVQGPWDRYLTRHPGPADIALLVEVSDSSLDHDREVKGPIYAAAGIPTYWILNLVDWVVEVYTQPTAQEYADRREYHRGESVPVVLAGQAVGQVPVTELLG